VTPGCSTSPTTRRPFGKHTLPLFPLPSRAGVRPPASRLSAAAAYG
jgi:hypothetical protein